MSEMPAAAKTSASPSFAQQTPTAQRHAGGGGGCLHAVEVVFDSSRVDQDAGRA
jgi:hypothetical protein